MMLKDESIKLASLFMFKDGQDTTNEENRAIVKVVEKLMFNRFEDDYEEDYDGVTSEVYLKRLLRNS